MRLRFTHPTYGFTVRVPDGWQVNQLLWAPPPPAGTYLSSPDAELVVSIIRWNESGVREQAALLQQGWRVQ